MYCGNDCPKCIDQPRFATFHCRDIPANLIVLSSIPKLMQEAQGPKVQNRHNWYFQTVASFSIVRQIEVNLTRHCDSGTNPPSCAKPHDTSISTAVQKLFIAIIVCKYTPLLPCMVFFLVAEPLRGFCSDGETRVTPSFFFWEKQYKWQDTPSEALRMSNTVQLGSSLVRQGSGIRGL